MAEETLMRLFDGSNTVNFSPTRGLDDTEDRGRDVHLTLDRTIYTYEWGNKAAEDLAVEGIVKVDADRVNTWWQDQTLLTFYPDYIGAPGTTVPVRIINVTRPLQMTPPLWQELYEGTILVHESS